MKGQLEETIQQLEKEWSVIGEIEDRRAIDFCEGQSFRRESVDSNLFPKIRHVR